MTQRMSTKPVSPKKGDDYQICYDFSGLPDSVTSVTIEVIESPPPGSDTITIDRPTGPDGDTGCTTYHADPNLVGVSLEDTSGNSNDLGVIYS